MGIHVLLRQRHSCNQVNEGFSHIMDTWPREALDPKACPVPPLADAKCTPVVEEKSRYQSLAGAARRIKRAGMRNVKPAILSVDRRSSRSARANCGNI